MVIYTYIIFLMIMGIVLLLQGFYIGRGKMTQVTIVSLILIFLSTMSIVFGDTYIYSGNVHIYSDIAQDMNIYNTVIATTYASSWWGLGYMASRLTLVKEDGGRKITIMKIDKKIDNVL